MPRLRPPRPLYKICVAYVVVNMQTLFPENASVAGALPANINEDIFATLLRTQPNNFALLILMLGSVLRSVTIPPGTALVEHAALSIFSQLSLNGEHLVELCLVLTGHHLEAFMALLPNLQSLQRLDLWLDDLTEPLVFTISRYCTRLRQLCLYRDGPGSYIRLLDGNEYEHLDALSAHLSMHILTSLPELRVFRISFLTIALLIMPATVRLQLSELLVLEPVVRDCPRVLSHISAICPMLTSLYLSLTDASDITPLSRLAFLDDLTLITHDVEDVIFMDLIEPLLLRIGGNLKRLQIFISDLDINCIIRFCPALRELYLQGLRRLINYSRRSTRSLEQLREFGLSLRVMSSLHPNRPFEFLQDYGQLTELYLRRCHLADSALHQLISSGTFLRLRELHLTEVHGVTEAGLKELVTAEGDLVLLCIIRCTHVTSADIGELRGLVRSMNLDLHILFSPPRNRWE